MTVKIFFCYAHEDELLLKKLKSHLSFPRRDRSQQQAVIRAYSSWGKGGMRYLFPLLFILPLVATLVFIPHIARAASTSNTLYITGTQSNSDNTSTTTLDSMDLTTGAFTQIGNPLESVLPGRNFGSNQSTYDPIGHRYFYWDENNGISYVIIQNTQTGAITTVPDSLGGNLNNLEFQPPTPPSISNIANAAINQGNTYIANGSFTDSDSTSWTATVNYGDNTGTNPLTLSGMNFSLSHVYNNLGAFTVSVNITGNDGLTGSRTALITVIPVNGLTGANLSHSNYTGADFDGQE